MKGRMNEVLVAPAEAEADEGGGDEAARENKNE